MLSPDGGEENREGGVMYERVSEPLKVKSLQLKNRIVMPPMATRMAGSDGSVTAGAVRYYRDRAQGGFPGLIIVEHSYVNRQGRTNPAQLGLDRDEMVPGYRKLVEAIHEEGVPVVAQINHGGSYTTSEVTGQELVSASAVIHPQMAARNGEVPRPLTEEEISGLVRDYAAAAARAKEAGCDGVEIHSAHGYLLNQFYSPLTNRRTDEYGCASLENRLRFACRVIPAVRAAVGEEYPVFLRLGGVDYMEGGSTLEDCVAAGRILEAAGIDLLDVTGGVSGYVRRGHSEPGYFREMTEALKQELRIPVLLTGGVTEAAQAEELLERGSADLIGVGRAVFRDADWFRKAGI